MGVRYVTMAGFLVLTSLVLFFARGRLVLENDLVASLRGGDPELAAVFEHFQGSSLFRGKIFVDFASTPPADRERALAGLAQDGFEQAALVELTADSAVPGEGARALAVHLPLNVLQNALSDASVDARANEILSAVLLPGGEGFAELARGDPFGLVGTVFAALSPSLSQAPSEGAGGTDVRVFKSPRPMDFDRAGRAYDLLASTRGAHFIGEDFFAYENYKTVRRDILVCSVVGFALNFLLYLLFIRDRRFLFFTLAGNAVSYAWGLFFGTLFFQGLYGVALAFTTTFLSFNNEYLVHLAGVDENASRGKKLGLLSAVGTTFLGFAALLAGSSSLVRQIALLSLGGMAGFLAFLWVFRGTLARIAFRETPWVFGRLKWNVGLPTLGVMTAACLVALAAVGVPSIGTRIREFRSFTPRLETDIAHFSAKASGFAGGRPYAVEWTPAAEEAFARWKAEGSLAPGSPWGFFASPSAQASTADWMKKSAPGALSRLSATLVEAGVDIGIDVNTYGSLSPQSPEAACALIERFSPLRACARAPSGALFAIAAFTSPPEGSTGVTTGRSTGGTTGRLWSLDAEPYYDAILSGFSRELAWLFAAGLAAMACYLYVLHRSWRALVYIFLPVLVSGTVVLLWLGARQEPLNVIHVLAFSLVIALGLDYSSVALSSRYAVGELSRVLLTGLSTLAAFGALSLAQHPVLRDLGMVVLLGAGFSLAFALFVRFSPEVRKASSTTPPTEVGGLRR